MLMEKKSPEVASSPKSNEKRLYFWIEHRVTVS
jgi:hypothetical protein